MPTAITPTAATRMALGARKAPEYVERSGCRPRSAARGTQATSLPAHPRPHDPQPLRPPLFAPGGAPGLASPAIAEHYFAYGSNLASRVIEAWAPAAEFVGPARLDGFRLAFLRRSVRWGAGAADVVQAPGHAVWGALYLVAENELEALDRKEYVAHSGYRRRDVEVVWAGRRVGAATYEVVDKADDELTPTLGYLALLSEGARERGLPAEWLAELASLPERFGLESDPTGPSPGPSGIGSAS